MPTASLTSTSPGPGWVEHDAAEIWTVTQAVAGRRWPTPACATASSTPWESPISARRSCVWDPGSGEPLAPAIVWQDRRTAARCDELRDGRPRVARARANRARAGPLFLGHEDRMAAGQRRRPARARPRWPRGVRHDRCVGDLQAHRRAGHRRLQRLADDAVRHLARGLGRRAAGPAGRSRACPAGGGGQLRLSRDHDGRRAGRPRGAGGGHRR